MWLYVTERGDICLSSLRQQISSLIHLYTKSPLVFLKNKLSSLDNIPFRHSDM